MEPLFLPESRVVVFKIVRLGVKRVFQNMATQLIYLLDYSGEFCELLVSIIIPMYLLCGFTDTNKPYQYLKCCVVFGLVRGPICALLVFFLLNYSSDRKTYFHGNFMDHNYKFLHVMHTPVRQIRCDCDEFLSWHPPQA